MSDVREFRLRRVGTFSNFGTAMCGLFTVYFLWRIYQLITGILSEPLWLVFVLIAAIFYMWYMRLAAVKAITVARDGSIVFSRYLGRREVHAIYVKRVRPWLNSSRRNFVLTHAHGFELLFEDPERVAEFVQELVRLNPDVEVRGAPPAPSLPSSRARA